MTHDASSSVMLASSSVSAVNHLVSNEEKRRNKVQTFARIRGVEMKLLRDMIHHNRGSIMRTHGDVDVRYEMHPPLHQFELILRSPVRSMWPNDLRLSVLYTHREGRGVVLQSHATLV